jgi:hypothetical protein
MCQRLARRRWYRFPSPALKSEPVFWLEHSDCVSAAAEEVHKANASRAMAGADARKGSMLSNLIAAGSAAAVRGVRCGKNTGEAADA